MSTLLNGSGIKRISNWRFFWWFLVIFGRILEASPVVRTNFAKVQRPVGKSGQIWVNLVTSVWTKVSSRWRDLNRDNPGSSVWSPRWLAPRVGSPSSSLSPSLLQLHLFSLCWRTSIHTLLCDLRNHVAVTCLGRDKQLLRALQMNFFM